MGNMQCPAEDAAHLAAVARDICPFPNYTPNPLFLNMLSINSSLHLKNHYRAVESSLTAKQLEDFTQGLRTTFGREGKVTLGRAGVVALSLAVLFDTLARQVRGEWVSNSEPIPGLFVKDVRGYYPPHVYTISEYLRLVPHIANNPNRMREQSEGYLKQITTDVQSYHKLGENHRLPKRDYTTVMNLMLGYFFTSRLKVHLGYNGTVDELMSGDRGPQDYFIFNLNCNPETADIEFLAQVQKSNRSREAFERCKPRSGEVGKAWLLYVADLEYNDLMFLSFSDLPKTSANSTIVQSQDFDLKANALGKWAD